MAQYWEAVREFYAPFETGMMASTADVYDERNPRRPVHQSVRAGQGRRPGQSLARHLPHVCRRESAVRRHRQGHAVVESRRRHGPVPDHQQPDRRRRARHQARAGLSRIGRRPDRRPHGPAARRISGQGAAARSCAGKSRCTAGPGPACRRPISKQVGRRAGKETRPQADEAAT